MFDDSGFANWDFDVDLSTKLVERFDIDFNYGVPYYSEISKSLGYIKEF